MPCTQVLQEALTWYPPNGRHWSSHQEPSSEPDTVAVIMALVFLGRRQPINKQTHGCITWHLIVIHTRKSIKQGGRIRAPLGGVVREGLLMSCPLSRSLSGEHFRGSSGCLEEGRIWQRALWMLRIATTIKCLLCMLHLVCSLHILSGHKSPMTLVPLLSQLIDAETEAEE